MKQSIICTDLMSYSYYTVVIGCWCVDQKSYDFLVVDIEHKLRDMDQPEEIIELFFSVYHQLQ